MGRKARNQQFVKQRYNPASFHVASTVSASPVIHSGLPSTFSEGPAFREEHVAHAEISVPIPGSSSSSAPAESRTTIVNQLLMHEEASQRPFA